MDFQQKIADNVKVDTDGAIDVLQEHHEANDAGELAELYERLEAEIETSVRESAERLS